MVTAKNLRILISDDHQLVREGLQRLRDNQIQLRALAHRLTTVREDEATRIAREIHNQMGQALTVLKMYVAALRFDLSNVRTALRMRAWPRA
jgi:signal transduction histidine kinase